VMNFFLEMSLRIIEKYRCYFWIMDTKLVGLIESGKLKYYTTIYTVV